MDSMNIAVIPARGGSKRIPRKNIKSFLGKPIISYSINTALQSGLFDEIIVSTDDAEIAEIAIKYGASVPFIRPQKLSDDYTGTNEVVAHAIKETVNEGIKDCKICCIYATAPFLQPSFLKQGLQTLIKKECHFSFSATSFSFPIQRAIKLSEGGGVSPFCPESIAKRSQDLAEAFHDAGQYYWGTASAFEKGELFSRKSVANVIPRYYVQDIDTEEDWKMAEYMYKVLLAAGKIE